MGIETMELCRSLVDNLQGIEYDCTAEYNSGIVDMMIVDKEAIASYVISAGTYATITLKPGMSAAKVQGYKKSLGATRGLKVNESAPNAETHSVFFTVFKRDAVEAAKIANYIRSRVVVIIQSKTTGVFEVYGLKSGLEASALESDANANGGFVKLTMTTPEDSLGDQIAYISQASYAVLENTPG